MNSIETIKNDIISEFSLFEDWMQKYEYIIELGNSIPLIDPKFKVDNNLIKGCQSKVWIHAELKDNNVFFSADSETIITKGIITIIIRVISNQEQKSIIESNTKFIDKIGLKEHLSPTRDNGLFSMVKQIKIYALAFKNKINKK